MKRAGELEQPLTAGQAKPDDPACSSFSYFGWHTALSCAVIYQAFSKLLMNSLLTPVSSPLNMLLGSGVGFLIGAPDMLGGKMGINLRGRDVGVAQ